MAHSPSSRSRLRRALCTLGTVALSTVGFATPAFAEGLAVSNIVKYTPADSRTDPDVKYWISKADCEREEKFTFTATFTSVATNTDLEVWATLGSTDCSIGMNRQTKDGQACFLVYSEPDPVVSTSVEISARTIADQFTSTADCSSTSINGQSVTLYFLVINQSEPSADVTEKQTWPTSIDLSAPDPPNITGITAGDGTLDLALGDVTAEAKNDTQRYILFCDPPSGAASSNGSCSCGNPGADGGAAGSGGNLPGPPPATGGTGGIGGMPTTGGTAMTGGMGGIGGMPTTGGTAMTGGMGMGGTTTSSTTTSSNTSSATGSTAAAGGSGGSGGSGGTGECGEKSADVCSSCFFAEGEEAPSEDSEYKCGESTNNAASTLQTDSIENGTITAVAIAVVDKVGNVSPLSPLQCATPTEVTDFYEAYRENGGRGGGGTCSLGFFNRANNAAGPALALLTASAFLFRRRRKTSKTKRIGGAQ
ncbi:MAG: hypothetical protein IPK82_03545 [Polyangiaceae bacterium]|nr:hypothetical protein [Polyangiaceae bacterium]